MNHKYIQKFETYILNKKDPNKEKEIKNKPKKETEPVEDEIDPEIKKDEDDDPIAEWNAYFDKRKEMFKI
jgi:hypothetical protein